MTRASAALESVGVECSCIKYLRLGKKGMFGKRKSKEGERTSLPLQTFPSWRGNLEFCARRAWIERGEIPRPVSEQKVRPRLPAPRVPFLFLCSLCSMDILPENDGIVADTPPLLSYDQDVAYEDQVQSSPAPPSLADRIGRTKVYLLSESNVTRGSKVRV